VLLCDETGTLIDGDDIMAIAALEMLAEGSLANNTLVSTVMSNAGLDAAIETAGGKVIRTDVGDKNVIDEMLKRGHNFGGEQSGHLIFSDHGTTGDGLVAALQILRIMAAKQKPLSELAKCWSRFPQQLTNIRASGKDDAIKLTPPKKLTLEQAISYIQDDELVEVTPNSIRLRKRFLIPHERKKAARAAVK